MARTAIFASFALVLLLAGCTDDFSRFKFGKSVRDAGSQNVSGAGSNSSQSRVDASTAEAKVQQKAGAGATGTAGSGQPQARGARSGTPTDAAQDLADRDD